MKSFLILALLAVGPVNSSQASDVEISSESWVRNFTVSGNSAEDLLQFLAKIVKVKPNKLKGSQDFIWYTTEGIACVQITKGQEILSTSCEFKLTSEGKIEAFNEIEK